jgi:hypothetical protein
MRRNSVAIVSERFNLRLLRFVEHAPAARQRGGLESAAATRGLHNELLLSALLDAAFDAGLVTFSYEGDALVSPHLIQAAVKVLWPSDQCKVIELPVAHRANQAWHRSRCGFA